MAKELRSGFTTGACAAAGVKAVLLYEQGKYWQEISLTALNGVIINIPIKAITETPAGFCAEVVKFSGDDPDITNGVSVFTTVSHLQNTKEIEFAAGPGIGKVTKAGLSLPIGEPAINNGPRQLIRNVVAEILGNSNAGLKITIAIPAGTKLAKKTLNPILGIEGGISVIGTTGVLRPMSEEGFKNSLVPQIDVAKAAGFKNLIFVPGKIGERIATEWGLPAAAMVQTSNFIGFMLEAAADRGIEQVLLFGHIGRFRRVVGIHNVTDSDFGVVLHTGQVVGGVVQTVDRRTQLGLDLRNVIHRGRDAGDHLVSRARRSQLSTARNACGASGVSLIRTKGVADCRKIRHQGIQLA